MNRPRERNDSTLFIQKLANRGMQQSRLQSQAIARSILSRLMRCEFMPRCEAPATCSSAAQYERHQSPARCFSSAKILGFSGGGEVVLWEEVTRSSLSRWESFYVIVGSSAGALTGLQFV